ncbi:MAG: hypothetical protein ACP5KA_05980 [Desulfurococcaceae archaeon]
MSVGLVPDPSKRELRPVRALMREGGDRIRQQLFRPRTATFLVLAIERGPTLFSEPAALSLARQRGTARFGEALAYKHVVYIAIMPPRLGGSGGGRGAQSR